MEDLSSIEKEDLTITMVDVLLTITVTTITIGSSITINTKCTLTSMDHHQTQPTPVLNGTLINNTFNNIPMDDKCLGVLLTKVQYVEKVNHQNNRVNKVIHSKVIKDKVVVDQSKGDRVIRVEVEADNSRMEIFFMLKEYRCTSNLPPSPPKSTGGRIIGDVNSSLAAGQTIHIA